MAPHRIHGWLAEPESNTFTRDGRSVRVEPKIMEVFVRLARGPGAVVTKAELLASVWPDVSVGEDALTRAISELRRALDDDARNPRIVETIPKRGYRLVAPVALDSPAPPADVPRTPRLRTRGVAMLVTTSAVTLLALGALRSREGPGAPAPATALQPLQVIVVPFDNRTDDPDLEDVVSASLAGRLGKEGDLIVVPSQRIQETLARMRRTDRAVTAATAAEVAQRIGGVAGIVTGELRRTGGEYILNVRVSAPSGAGVLGQAMMSAPDVAAVLRRAEREAPSLRASIQARPPDRLEPLPAVTTPSLTALRIFAQAVAIADSVAPAWAGSWPKATELFEKAVAEDKTFAMARAWLALALKFSEETDLSNRGGLRGPPELFRSHAEASLALAADEQVSTPERLFIEGVAGMLLEQRPKAIAAFEALLWSDGDFFPVRTRGLLASLYEAEGRWSDRDDQVLKLAELMPDDLDAAVTAAEALVLRGDMPRARALAHRVRARIVPAIARRESSSWAVAWLEHLTVYENWSSGDLDGAVREQARLSASLSSRASAERDAIATTSGYWWLTLGRLQDARRAFEAVGHEGQRHWNLARMADLLDDRQAMAGHLKKVDWAYDPVPYARAGLFDDARRLMQQPTVSGNRAAREAIAQGEEALSGGEIQRSISLLQHAVEMLRPRPRLEFYEASLSLAEAWQRAANPVQANRVLEEAALAQPAYVMPGTPGAWWIKVQARLTDAYRAAGREEESRAVGNRLLALLARADPDHPLLPGLRAAMAAADAPGQ